MIALGTLQKIMPLAGAKAVKFVDPLNAAMAEFEIDTPLRQAAFLAQLAHESGEFRYVRELASGAAYDTGRLAKRLGNTPEADGDGQRYRGRGLIQITGRSNYAACGAALDVDLLAQPEQLELPDLACRSAGWFWHSKELNALADAHDFTGLTYRINGGFNGLSDRLNYYARAKKVLGVEA
jgi:putative chitinase